MPRSLRGVLLSAALAALASPVSAQSVVRGEVIDTAGRPIPGVEIAVTPWGRVFTTSATGAFLVDSIPAGEQRVLFRLVGYRAQHFTRAWGAADTIRVEVVLAPGAVELEPLEIVVEAPRVLSPAMAVFQRRRDNAVGGSFLDTDHLREQEHLPLAEVLRRVAGVRLINIPGGGRAIGTTRGRACFVQVYLDGLRLWGPRDLSLQGPYNIDLHSTVHVQAVEFYRGAAQTPMELHRPDASCGTIVIWTREAER